MPRPARRRAFTVIAVPATLVLVWDVAPAEIQEGLIGYHAKGLQRINAPRPDCAQMLPLVPKIEHVRELLTGTQSAQGQAPIVEQVLRVVILVAEDPQTVPVGTRELVQVASVPASERVINRGGELVLRAALIEHASAGVRGDGLAEFGDDAVGDRGHGHAALPC